MDRFEYGYDRASNRVWRNNPLTNGHDEFYTYDGLHRLTGTTRGDLNGTNTGIVSAGATFAQDWDLDPLGNWDAFQQDDNGDGSSGWDLDQTRTHNDVNEITGITGGGWVTPTHDAAGNVTKLPQPDTAGGPTQGFDVTYDPWNRLVKLADSGTSQTVAEYTYNGLDWRVIEKTYVSGVLDETRYTYYRNNWQLLEERVNGTSPADAERQYVWGLRYIDDLVERDSDGSGDLDQRHYAIQDAGYNITTITDTNANPVERYDYSPYGQRQVLDANFASDADGLSDVDWQTGHQGLRHDVASGAIYHRQRLRFPTISWLQREPLGYIDGANLYQFAISSPLYWLDPTGLDVTIENDPDEGTVTITDKDRGIGMTHVYDKRTGQHIDTIHFNPNEYGADLESQLDARNKGDLAEIAQLGKDIETVGKVAVLVGLVVLPGPDDVIMSGLAARNALQWCKKGGKWLKKVGDDLVELTEAELEHLKRQYMRAKGQRIPAPDTPPGIPGLKPAKEKTPVQGGGGRRERWKDSKGNIYEWDSQHGRVEKYNKRGKHQGEFDPDTGQQTKPADPSRHVEP